VILNVYLRFRVAVTTLSTYLLRVYWMLIQQWIVNRMTADRCFTVLCLLVACDIYIYRNSFFLLQNVS